jgi:hypothetical protein
MIAKNGAGPRHRVGDDGPREDRLGSAINLTHTALDRTTQAPLQISADLEETAIAISPAAFPVVVQGYDYAALSSDTADLARRTAEKIRQHQQQTSREVIEVGADLIRVKNALGHGRFGKWLTIETGWSIRTAQRYMRAAEVFGPKCDTVSFLPPPATLYLLSARSTSETIVGEVIDRLENGERVDADNIKATVQAARERAREEKRKHQKRKLSESTLKRHERERQKREDEEQKRREEVEAIAQGLIEEIGAANVKRVLECDWYVQDALRRLIGEVAL